MTGVLNIDKPKGMTSSDVVVKVRKLLGTKAIGHFGTLDPMGEGVLLMGVGKATRLFDLMLEKDKVYEAEFIFGLETDTLDTDGNILSSDGKVPALDEIISVLPQYIGTQMQMPPAYSAKSINGKRAYELAREGKSVDLRPCEIEIFGLDAAATEAENRFKITLHCSSGTYVRSFGRDLAAKLGTVAAMSSIRRTRCGRFSSEDSVSLKKLEKLKEKALIPVDKALDFLPRVDIDESLYKDICNGFKPESRGVKYDKFLLYCKGELFGIAKINSADRMEITSYLKE